MIQRREVKSPFTKEERQGVFMTIEEARKRRKKLEYNPDKYRLVVNDKEITGYTSDEEIKLEPNYEFNYDLERMQKAVESETVYLPKGIKEKGEIMEWLLNYDTDKIKSAINLSKSINGVEVLGDNKEERIKHMKQIFEDYEDK